MRVLLRSDVDGVGRRGDIVEVAKGFARNYLFPTGRGLEATAGVQAQAEAMRRVRAAGDVRALESARDVAASLGEKRVTISARVGAEGKLFGSVTAADVRDALEAQLGVSLDRRAISIADPIKHVGDHLVPVELHSEVLVELTVEVVSA